MWYVDPCSSFELIVIGTMPRQINSSLYAYVVNVVFDKDNIAEIILIVKYTW